MLDESVTAMDAFAARRATTPTWVGHAPSPICTLRPSSPQHHEEIATKLDTDALLKCRDTLLRFPPCCTTATLQRR